MKLTKLSLAAIVAVGALSSFASATPLEEAIKGVDVSGMARLRYYANDGMFGVRDNGGRGQNAGVDDTQETIRVSGAFNAIVPISDGWSFGTTAITDGYNRPDTAESFPTGIEFDKFFFQYAGGGLTLKAGKFEIPTPWTEAGFAGNRGNGVLALYGVSPSWTLAAAAYLQTGGSAADDMSFIGYQNLYALAALGKVGPVGLQFWAASMEHTIDWTLFAEAAFAQSGFNVRGQVNFLQAADEVAPDSDTAIFAGAEGGYKNDQFYVNGGVTYNFDIDKGAYAYALDNDNDGFIKFGKQLYYKTTNVGDVMALGVKGGVTVNKFGLEAGVAFADFGKADFLLASEADVDESATEFYGLVSYQLAKNLSAEVFYSVFNSDDALFGDNNELRFQAQYNF